MPIPNKVNDILRKKEDAETLQTLKHALLPLGYRDITFEKKWDKEYGMRIGITMTWPGHQVPETLSLTLTLPEFEEWMKSKCRTQPVVLAWFCSSENPTSSFGRVLKSSGVHYVMGGKIQNFSSSTPVDSVVDPLTSLRKMDID